MGRIILTFAGPWNKAPALDTKLDVAFGEPDPEVVDEMIAIGRRAAAFSDDDVRALRRHRGLLGAEVEFDAPGDRGPAERAARFALDAFAAGAHGLWVETAEKVFAPAAFDRLDATDPRTLFHVFVEVLGDRERIGTEGMQAFDLPEVAAPYASKAELGPAQAATFGAAALMVCAGFRPVEGIPFRATESAPAFMPRFESAADDPEDLFLNPRGTWVFERR